jgi:SAM-dependent methyltransferase
LKRLAASRGLDGDRKLADLHPDLERRSALAYLKVLRERQDEPELLELRLERLGRLLDLRDRRHVLVVGCGPRPETIQQLCRLGYDAVGVEVNRGFAELAREYLHQPELVLEGEAEALPCADATFDLVFCDNVLEHVISPRRALAEMHRVLAPGGAAYVVTTNRFRISLTGRNGEFRVPYFNWLPATLKESLVFQHLHFDPGLANYAVRPAVHWFTYAELCALGREAGFEHFYSPLDLSEPGDAPMRRSRFKRWLLPRVKKRPWLRALALLQVGAAIIMSKPNRPVGVRATA